MSSLFAVFFLLCLSLHACNARRLGFVADQHIIGDQGHNFLSKDYVLISKEVVHGRRIQDGWIGANTMKQTLFNCFLEAKQAVAKAISGHAINYSIVSSRVDDNLKSMEKEQGVKRVTRSMLANSAGDSSEDEEAVHSKEKDNVGDVDVMDYAQPHRKPPIHNEKS